MQGYFEDEEFFNYLKYLEYFKKEPYIKYIEYPTSFPQLSSPTLP